MKSYGLPRTVSQSSHLSFQYLRCIADFPGERGPHRSCLAKSQSWLLECAVLARNLDHLLGSQIVQLDRVYCYYDDRQRSSDYLYTSMLWLAQGASTCPAHSWRIPIGETLWFHLRSEELEAPDQSRSPWFWNFHAIQNPVELDWRCALGSSPGSVTRSCCWSGGRWLRTRASALVRQVPNRTSLLTPGMRSPAD